MADRKISDLTALTTPATGDLIPIVDVSEAAAADKNKSITVQELFKGVPDGTAAAPGLAFESDDGNGIFLAGTDQVGVATGGVERVEFGASEVVFNDGGASYDFRIEGNTNTALFFVDASTDRIGVGTTSPARPLDVVSDSGARAIQVRGRSSDNIGLIDFYSNDGATRYATIGAPAASQFAIETGNTEKLRIDSSGHLLVGTTSARIIQPYGLGSDGQFANTFEDVSDTDPGPGIALGANNSTINRFGPYLYLFRSRGSSVGSNTIVSSGDNLGTISFAGADGTNVRTRGAAIYCEVDGTPGSSDMPGRLVFSTTADGASNPTERARITQDGFFKASNTGSYQGTSGYHEFRTSSNDQGLYLHATHASYSEHLILGRATRAGTSAYKFILFQSDNGSDTEYNLQGNGNAFADGTWSGGGADYAEYFEWSDGNTGAEDRRGISVVLDGDKIREAIAGEDPIGVISGNPSVVGDAAWNKWKGKHLRDEFGSYLLDAEGYRQLNPDYDPDVEYVSREDRPEWDCVGLMGKLRIRKGQVTGARWIKMRDVSDNVEEWLVR